MSDRAYPTNDVLSAIADCGYIPHNMSDGALVLIRKDKTPYIGRMILMPVGYDEILEDTIRMNVANTNIDADKLIQAIRDKGKADSCER